MKAENQKTTRQNILSQESYWIEVLESARYMSVSDNHVAKMIIKGVLEYSQQNTLSNKESDKEKLFRFMKVLDFGLTPYDSEETEELIDRFLDLKQ